MVRQLKLVVLTTCLMLTACGGSSGNAPSAPITPPPPQVSQLEQLITALRAMTFQQALASSELSQFVDLIVAEGDAFIIDEQYLDDGTDAIRLGAVRALGALEVQSGLTPNATMRLEQKLASETNTTVLEEAQSLLVVIYGRLIDGLAIDTVETDQTFVKLVSLLIDMAESGIVADDVLGSTNVNLVLAGVSALREIETTVGLSDQQTIHSLEQLRSPALEQAIVDIAVDVLQLYYPRSLLEELGGLPDRLLQGIASRQMNGVYYEDGFYTANAEASVLWGGYAAIASLYAGGETTSARAFLEFFLADFTQSADFNGFDVAYDIDGNPVLNRPSMESALLVCFVGLHYTAVSNDDTYLPMVFATIDWMETRLLNTSLSLFEQSLLGFSPTAPSDGFLITNDSLVARALFHEMEALLKARNLFPDRQIQSALLADTMDQGLSAYPWIDNRFILIAQATNGGSTYFPLRYTATGEPIYDSKDFLISTLYHGKRPLPGGLDPADHLADAQSLFAVDLDIEGFTYVETSSPLIAVDVPMMDSTALWALAWWSLADYANWKRLALQIGSQAVDIGGGRSLLPHATRPYNGIWHAWPGPEAPAVSPTAFFLLMIHRNNPYEVPEGIAE